MTDVARGTLTRAFGYQGDHMNLSVANVSAAVPYYESILSHADPHTGQRPTV